MGYFTQAKKMLLLAFILILLFTANLWAQFPEGFEGGEIPSTWKTYGYFSAQPAISHAHSGIYVVSSGNGYYPDDWLITPQFQITENHRGIRFWARPIESDQNEDFKIHLSTTGRTIADFNVELANYTQPGTSWKEYYVDLSDYIGESVYIAIHRFYDSSSHSNGMYFDDFDWLYSDDLSAISINGSKTPIVNASAEYTVRIKNTGVNTQSDYTVSLFADKEEIARQAGTEIAAGETKDIILYWTPDIEKRYNLHSEVNMGGDLYQENNQSADFTIAALSSNANESYVGDPNSDCYSDRYPINNYYSGLSQTFYLASELETTGFIYSIEYDVHLVGNGMLIPIKIWMANTNKGNYDNDDDWLAYEEFSLVFDSEVDFSAIEENKISILLDNPFLYSGDNLCIMVQNPWNAVNGPEDSHEFKTTSIGSIRTLCRHSHDEINPFNPPGGYREWDIPNTSFMIDNSMLSSISGIVYSNSIPQAGVKVEIENTRRYAITDAEGKYEIQNLQAGNYNLIASKEGFNDKRVTNLVLAADDTLIQDITITKLPMLTISGQIIDSLSGLGIGGAQINLTGYEDYETISTETGAFTIPFVYAREDYLIKVQKTDYDYYEDNISTNMNNLVLSAIELNKIPEYFDQYVGDLTTSLFTHASPINFNSRASISQTIYLAEEINKDYLIGEASINSLRYFANLDGDIINGKPVKIYMANAEIESFNTNNAWLSANNFSLVYDGNIDLHKPGNQEIDFILDTPFDYTGHNLAIMIIRPLDETVYSVGNSWKCSESDLYPNRTIYRNSSIDPNITSPGTGTRQNSIPNIVFAFNTVGYASISGIVSNEIGPIEDVKVEIEGTNRSVMTNAAGEYQLQNLNPGVFNLLASKEGYIDTRIDNVELNINEEIVRDILITDRPLVSVSGKIIASDTGLPLEGAIIKLDNQVTETDNTGEYLFNNIYGGKSYLLSISREGYLRHKELIEIALEDQTIPDIVLEISPEIYQLLVGDTESNTSSYQYPLNFNSKASLSQTIYTAEELDAYHAVDYDYEICSIKYYANFSSNIPAGRELQIWMANTEISEFANNSSWLPLNEFTQVFAGTLDISTGVFELDIELDTPFNYTGDNLVIMVKRNLDTNYYNSNDKFYTSAVTDNRTIYYQTDTRDPD
ncbi:MAG: carboxypeptidase regulatory-like domain-containing protein, partial [Candidatus Cloacimonadales bacterium]|nr:carboxypeptidase regulatory-like domain-containing protein [Candidatus Cloacimonadales bacterium]